MISRISLPFLLMSILPSHPQVQKKVARSRFVLIDNLAEYPVAARQCPGMNWDDFIPPDSPVFSMNRTQTTLRLLGL
jgi:hypothetical protein